MSSLEQVTQQSVAVTRDRSRAIFGQTMGLVAVTAGVAGFGAYLGRVLSRGVAMVAIIGAIVCIVAMNAAIKRSEQLAIGLLFGMGALIGVSSARSSRTTRPSILPRRGSPPRDRAVHRGVRRDGTRPGGIEHDRAASSFALLG